MYPKICVYTFWIQSQEVYVQRFYKGKEHTFTENMIKHTVLA